jgi:hypothetical protein
MAEFRKLEELKGSSLSFNARVVRPYRSLNGLIAARPARPAGGVTDSNVYAGRGPEAGKEGTGACWRSMPAIQSQRRFVGKGYLRAVSVRCGEDGGQGRKRSEAELAGVLCQPSNRKGGSLENVSYEAENVKLEEMVARDGAGA